MTWETLAGVVAISLALNGVRVWRAVVKRRRELET